MQQTKLTTGACLPTPSDNISVPIGLIKAVEHYLEKTGVLEYIDTFKEKGVPMRKIAIAMCTHILMGNNSMSRCSDWLSDPFVRKELGIDSGLSQRTINRAIALIGSHSDQIIVKLWEGLDSVYHFENTDINIDGSAAVVNGPNAELGAIGYPRDFRDQSRPQVEFLTAELQQSRISFFIRAYPGNASDPEQYRDALPDIFFDDKGGFLDNHGQRRSIGGHIGFHRFLG